MDNLISLHHSLRQKTYTHGPYQAFNISDPKPRNIHKASVGDRLLHHAVYRVLYPYFDKRFIHDSYSCRLNKGTHKAINQFRNYARKVSRNNTKQCWILKCDIKKFFASIDHQILRYIVVEHLDRDTQWLLNEIVGSFHTNRPHPVSSSHPSPRLSQFGGQAYQGGGKGGEVYKGLPLGNLTSQLLVNIYMNEFDQFIKHKLKVKHYIRYTDDFVIFHQNKLHLQSLIPQIQEYLETNLKLTLHPNKVFLKTLSSGIDFLGWVHFPNHRVLRTSTKRRMMKNLKDNSSKETKTSYLGLLRHGNTYKLKIKISGLV
ncbi:MAG: reverse transcriptase/maturase family protein [Patescibacteria group bacterium]